MTQPYDKGILSENNPYLKEGGYKVIKLILISWLLNSISPALAKPLKSEFEFSKHTFAFTSKDGSFVTSYKYLTKGAKIKSLRSGESPLDQTVTEVKRCGTSYCFKATPATDNIIIAFHNIPVAQEFLYSSEAEMLKDSEARTLATKGKAKLKNCQSKDKTLVMGKKYKTRTGSVLIELFVGRPKISAIDPNIYESVHFCQVYMIDGKILDVQEYDNPMLIDGEPSETDKQFLDSNWFEYEYRDLHALISDGKKWIVVENNDGAECSNLYVRQLGESEPHYVRHKCETEIWEERF